MRLAVPYFLCEMYECVNFAVVNFGNLKEGYDFGFNFVVFLFVLLVLKYKYNSTPKIRSHLEN